MNTKITLSQAKEMLAKKECSSTELVQSFINQATAKRHLNCFITETFDNALAQAHEADKRIASGNALPLDGLPIANKDLYCTQDIRTTAGSNILKNFVPPYESTVSGNLKKAGAISLGKLNMDEFAMGSANLNSAYGPVINPWRSASEPSKDLVPGGSSGGSAASVAAGLCLGATASDTGGSIRQPAAFCGITGIKPTYGLCSRWGMVAFASSLDQAGPMAHTIADCALLLQHMAGYDDKDATSLNVTIPDYAANLKPEAKGLRIGLPKEYLQGLNPEGQELLQKGINWLKAEGAEIVDISLKMTAAALPTYYIIAPAEASANLARYDGVRYGARVDGATLDEMYRNTRHDGFGAEVKRRIMIGTYVLSAGYYDAYYTRAQKVKKLISQDFDNAFEKVDAILTPTTPSAAFGLHDSNNDPVAMYLNDIYTVTVNLAELPGVSIPAGLSADGLPLGLQLIGPKLSEQLLFNVGLTLEQAAAFPHFKAI
jgi:aspartyl-tRNA(Asn)/glutamyl-tRNA(Gln) amidotransferase subunit A